MIFSWLVSCFFLCIQHFLKIFVKFFFELFLLVINITIPTGIKYKDSYANTNAVIGEYQYYNINAFYGAGDTTYKRYDASGNIAEANVPLVSMMNSPYSTEGWFVDRVIIDSFRIDVFSDIIGLILLIFVCFSINRFYTFVKFITKYFISDAIVN